MARRKYARRQVGVVTPLEPVGEGVRSALDGREHGERARQDRPRRRATVLLAAPGRPSMRIGGMSVDSATRRSS